MYFTKMAYPRVVVQLRYITPTMAVDICSLNVRGLGSKLKREQVFHWLKEQSFDIYFLQETHLPSSLKKTNRDGMGSKRLFERIKS